MQVIQGRKGADLLAYSESLEDVSVTATSVEAWRSLGYWLMYIRDPYAPTTTAGADYMTDLLTIVCGFVLVVVALVGLALVRFPARRYAIAVTFTGLVLAVGVHPFSDPSPIARLFRGDGQAGLSLALRSSTRALPLLAIGLALGTAALVDAIGPCRRLAPDGAGDGRRPGRCGKSSGPHESRSRRSRLSSGTSSPPTAWTDAAAALDDLPPGFRVLHLPGAEFGAFTWGYTVDPPLPALTERPMATRDLLPLGSPAAMDLLYALDDRFQVGSAELAAVAPIARLFGADTIWLPGDAAFDRFRTPRPELTAELFAGGADGLGDPRALWRPGRQRPPGADGRRAVARPSRRSDRRVAPIELVPVVDPVPIVRASDTVVLLSGSGDGIVDAAAGRVDRRRRSDPLQRVVVRQTNWRRRSRRPTSSWSPTATGAAPTTGAAPRTSPATPNRCRARRRCGRTPATPVSTSSPTPAPAAYTVSVQDGPVAATATSYGERFSYLPEARPALAIDGDPNTSWTVLDPAGQFIEITTAAAVDHITVLQPRRPARRPTSGDGLRDGRRW